jgi:hypothetical protein
MPLSADGRFKLMAYHSRFEPALSSPRLEHSYCQADAPNLSAARAFAFAASSSRFFGGAVVSSERRSRWEIPAISSIAARNAPSFAFDGLLNPLIFLTNCSEAARTSPSVTGGSKLKSVLMFLHTDQISSVIGYWLSILSSQSLTPIVLQTGRFVTRASNAIREANRPIRLWLTAINA